jgi:alpha-L-fucosidase
VDCGPKQDIIGALANATGAAGLRFGAYHSLFEFFNPLYLKDKANNWATDTFVTQKTGPELYDLVARYEPEIIWSDGDWEPPGNSTYWNSTAFLAWLVNDSPVADTVVFNDRWGENSLCEHGSFYTCADRYLPGSLVGHPWENALSIDTQSWGYRRNAPLSDYLTAAQLIATVVQTVALGGNALINVGPAADGTIDAIFADRLTALGGWLGANGDAIYATTPWRVQNETARVWYTQEGRGGGAVFAIFLAWPPSGQLHLSAPVTAPNSSVALLGWGGGPLPWAPLSGPDGVRVTLPALVPGTPLAAAPAWALRLESVK